MAKIILDFGSGNTCKNRRSYIKLMFDSLKKIDTKKHEIIVKFQLFSRAGKNIPLKHDVFSYAYNYGNKIGYKVTSSVFDQESLSFLLNYDIPFVKIANNRMLDILIPSVPEDIKLYISGDCDLFIPERKNWEQLWCISKYPATFGDYEKLNLFDGCKISDHTINFNLYNKYNPKVIEWHYKLKYSTGLDSGPFARTPQQLCEVL